MKNILYIDRAFQDALGGDKNRSRYLHNTLKEDANLYTCIIQESWEEIKEASSLIITVERKKSIFLPRAISEFSQQSLDDFVSFIKKNEITDLFFRTIAFNVLATYAKKQVPSLNIVIDADLILSRLMQQTWNKSKSFDTRYYFIQQVKLSMYERHLYKNNFTYLFSNEKECKDIQKKYPNTKVVYLPNTTHLEARQPSFSKSKTILFYGSMNSTANQDSYKYIHDVLVPKIQDTLIENNYTISVVGKGCDSLFPSKHSCLKIVGKVDSIESTILDSTFVLLPIYIASGTNTRVIETAIAGRALITTPLGMEGLSSSLDTTYVALDSKDMANKIKNLIENNNECLNLAKRLQDEIVSTFSYANFEKTLRTIMETVSKNKISLVHVPRRFTKIAWGGTETVVMNSIKHLNPLGYTSSIYTSKALDENPLESMDSVPVKRFNYFYPFFGLKTKQKKAFDAIGGNMFSFSLLWALLMKKDMQLVHLHTLKRIGAIVRTVAKWKKIPYVITLHGGYFDISSDETSHRQKNLEQGYEWGKILGFIFGSRAVLDDASAIITLSKKEYDIAHKKFGDKVKYLSNGVDIDTFSQGDGDTFKKAYGIAQNAEIILCSARIDTQKNQLLLLESFHKLCKKNTNLHLVLLGAVSDEIYLAELSQYISQNNLEKNISFIHNLTPEDQLLVDAYKSATMLVLPSRHEPFGMVILEAWSAGIPVVASLTGGIGKIIDHGKNGLLFENRNLDDLHEKMESLLYSEDLKENLIKNASHDVKEYDWKNIASSLDTIYKDVLKP